MPKDSIIIRVEHFDGQDEDDVGYAYYVATSDDLHFVTHGATFEELMRHIRECLQLCLLDTDSVEEYGVLPNAKVQIMMELSQDHAATA